MLWSRDFMVGSTTRYNPGHYILTIYCVSAQVWIAIIKIIKFLQDLPHELSNDLRLLVLSILHYTKNEVFHKGLVFIVSFKHISHFVLVFLLLTLNMQLQAGNRHCGSWDLKAQSQFLATESRLKGMKNAFYFTVKTLFVLKIFHFLSWFFGHVEIYDVTTWKANNCNTHIAEYLDKWRLSHSEIWSINIVCIGGISPPFKNTTPSFLPSPPPRQ